MALTDKLTAIGDAIREKNGTTDLIPLADMPQAILDISGGGTIDLLQYVKTARMLFHSAKSFPSKAVINLPNVCEIYQAFAYWNAEPIPIVEELTVTAPNINVNNNQACMGQMFTYNNGVKKVTLDMPDESQYMNSTFSNCGILEEVVLNFSTKNVLDYASAFANARKLKRIVGVLDFSSATNVNYMLGCNELEYVRFAPNTLSLTISLVACSKLTSESIQSIIVGLATVETARTLALNKAIVLTDEQKATINAKGWTLAQ